METTNSSDEKQAASGASQEGVCPMRALREAPRADSVTVNREDPAFLAVAYDTYASMRALGPVVRAPFGQNVFDKMNQREGEGQAPQGSDRLFVTRYDEAVSALLDERLSSDFRSGMTPEQRAHLPDLPEEYRPLIYSLLMLDPPDHTRLRKLVQPNFTPTVMEALRPRIQQLADALLDRAEREASARGEARGERSMDLVQAFAYPLPVTVISDLLGIPAEDREKVHGWAEMLTDDAPRERMDERRRGMLRDFSRYLDGLFERKLRAPTDDMISQMVHVREEGDRLSHQEMVSMVFILFFAGHVTTVNLIGSGVVALLTHPAQRDLLLADPSLAKGAVEETLRYWGPVDYMSTPRIVLKDMEISGTRIPEGDKLSVGLASANRDPLRFPDPDVFDITRADAGRNLAFGKGIHLCIGAPLARIEAQVAFETLFKRYPTMRLAVPAEELRFSAVASLRGFARVPVLF